MKNRPITQAGRRERGNTLVEFALSFALLFTVFTGVFRFGYVYYLYNRLESSVRGGARYGSLRAYDSATATPSGGYQTAVQNMAVYGNPKIVNYPWGWTNHEQTSGSPAVGVLLTDVKA